jgi:flagellar biosynthetic protein FliQ
MTPETVVEVMRHALLTAFWLAAPLLAIGFLAGIAISLVQIATSIQDNAVGSIPRLTAFLAGLLLLLPWMLERIMTYTTALFVSFVRYAH